MPSASVEQILIFRLSRCYSTKALRLQQRWAAPPQTAMSMCDVTGPANFYRSSVSRPTSACIGDVASNLQRHSSRNCRSRPDLRSRFSESPGPRFSSNVMPSAEPFPYPDPLPSWFPEAPGEPAAVSLLRGVQADPEAAFLKRICRLARLEGETKRQEDRRSSAVVSRQSSAKRRPSERSERPLPPSRRFSAPPAPPPRPESRQDPPAARRRNPPAARQRLMPAACMAVPLDDDEDAAPPPRPPASSYGRLLPRRTIAPCPAPESSMLIRLDNGAKPALRYVGGSDRTLGSAPAPLPKPQNAAVLGSGFRAFPATTRVNF